MQIQWFDTDDTNLGGSSILLSLGDESHFGLGEIYIAAGVARASLIQLMRESACRLMNVDLRNINVALEAVSSATDHDINTGPLVHAALDVALHDLNGKLRGCPVHTILGGCYRNEVMLSQSFRSGAAVSVANSGAKAVLLEYRQEPLRQSTSFGPNSATGWLTAAMDQLGAAVQIDIDAKSAFDNPALARTFIEGLLSGGPRLNLGLLQPLSDTDLVGHATLCATLPIPVILDSSVRSAKDMGQIVRLGAADRIVVNVERVGGLRAAMQIVSIAEAASIGVSSASFCCTAIGAAAALHLAAVLHDTFPARLDNLLADVGPIAGAGFAVDASVARVGSAPGLGVVLRDDAIAAFKPVA